MAPRANWKGFLKLSLVTCPIAMYSATSSSSRISFNTLNRRTGNPVKRQYVDSVTNEVVEPPDQVKGFKIGENSYVTIEDDELDAIKLKAGHTIEIENFIDYDEIDERYLDTPHYLVPDTPFGSDAFTVIRDAMRERGKAGIGRIVLSRRERILLVEDFGDGLKATTLRFADEVRKEEPYFEKIPKTENPDEMLRIAVGILDAMTRPFDPDELVDRYELAVVDLIKSKQAKRPPKPPVEERADAIPNLLEALRRSLADVPRRGSSAVSPRKRKPAKRDG